MPTAKTTVRIGSGAKTTARVGGDGEIVRLDQWTDFWHDLWGRPAAGTGVKTTARVG